MGKCVIYMSIKNLVMFQDHLNFRVIKSKKQAYIIEETKNIYSKWIFKTTQIITSIEVLLDIQPWKMAHEDT